MTPAEPRSRRQYRKLRPGTTILRALKLFYMSLGSFAAAALISLFGSVFAASGQELSFSFIALPGLLAGTVGVAGLSVGGAHVGCTHNDAGNILGYQES
jgi:hypothetical protein